MMKRYPNAAWNYLYNQLHDAIWDCKADAEIDVPGWGFRAKWPLSYALPELLSYNKAAQEALILLLSFNILDLVNARAQLCRAHADEHIDAFLAEWDEEESEE